jgi:site-specific recombinase XerD
VEITARHVERMSDQLPCAAIPAVFEAPGLLAGPRPIFTLVAAAGRAVRRFLSWCQERRLSLLEIMPDHVGQYIRAVSGSFPTRKLHLAALRSFFSLLSERHLVVLNAAASVRGERYAAVEGRTPEITADQARALLKSLNRTTAVGIRDRAIIATLAYTLAVREPLPA